MLDGLLAHSIGALDELEHVPKKAAVVRLPYPREIEHEPQVPDSLWLSKHRMQDCLRTVNQPE